MYESKKKQKYPAKVEYLNYLGNMITNDANCKRGTKTGIAMEKAAFNGRKNFFRSKSAIF